MMAVPLDPMVGGGRPIGYLARADDPAVYSVGLDAADDAASEAAMPDEYGELGEWRRLDRVFHLTRHVRPLLYVARPGDPPNIAFVGGEPDVAPWERDAAAAAP